MFLTAHSAIGIAIATKAANPWLAFVFAFIAHYFLDTIPHGDESIFNKSKSKKQRYSKILSFLTADLIVTGIYVLIIMTKTPLNPIILFAAILGSILPDILWGLYDVTKIKILKPFVVIHSLFHNPTKKNLSLIAGIVIQVIVIIIATLYII